MCLAIDNVVDSFKIGVILIFLREFVMELIVDGAQTGEGGRLFHYVYGKLSKEENLNKYQKSSCHPNL